jgi:hypothetical protein
MMVIFLSTAVPPCGEKLSEIDTDQLAFYVAKRVVI